MLLSGPSMFQMLGAERELRPFIMFMWGLFGLAVLWLVAMLVVAFRHRGKNRTLTLAVTFGMAAIFLGLSLVPLKTTTNIKVDLPPASGAAR
jgi:uncharacterized membrane protein YhdT